jgi:hypothetical protein
MYVVPSKKPLFTATENVTKLFCISWSSCFFGKQTACYVFEQNTDRQPTPRRRVLERLIVTQLAEKFSAFYESRSFITMFARALNIHFQNFFFSYFNKCLIPIFLSKVPRDSHIFRNIFVSTYCIHVYYSSGRSDCVLLLITYTDPFLPQIVPNLFVSP